MPASLSDLPKPEADNDHTYAHRELQWSMGERNAGRLVPAPVMSYT